MNPLTSLFAAWRVRGKASRVFSVAWAALLIVYVAFNSLRPPKPRQDGPVFDIVGPTPILESIYGRKLPLFESGHSYAIAFVSSRCDVCWLDAERIAGTLHASAADRRLIVALDDPAHVATFQRVYTDDALYFPEDGDQLRRIKVREVPTFVVVDRAGNTLLSQVGVPRGRQLWLTARRISRRENDPPHLP
jgi:hypothetical protein